MGNIYKVGKRDIEAYGELYALHVDHMTRESLHSKSDIAAELAYRDKRIAELETERDAMEYALAIVAYDPPSNCSLFAEGSLVRIKGNK